MNKISDKGKVQTVIDIAAKEALKAKFGPNSFIKEKHNSQTNTLKAANTSQIHLIQ